MRGDGLGERRRAPRSLAAIATALLVLFAGSPSAVAGGATISGLKGKVKKLQQQLAALEQQVESIELQPGPQGPPGSTGIGPDSVALGTQTTGNYVGSVATPGSGGLTGGATGSEGTNLSLGLDYSNTLASNSLAANQAVFGSTGLLFEGSLGLDADDETLLTVNDPTGDRTITLPNASGQLLLQGNVNTGSPSGSAGPSSQGVPVFFRFNVTNGSSATTFFAGRDFEVMDAWSVAASSDGGTWTVRNATTDNSITNTVTVPAADQAITRAAFIDDADASVTDNNGLSLAATGSLDATVYVLAVPE
jgi:hypothetical protein